MLIYMWVIYIPLYLLLIYTIAQAIKLSLYEMVITCSVVMHHTSLVIYKAGYTYSPCNRTRELAQNLSGHDQSMQLSNSHRLISA